MEINDVKKLDWQQIYDWSRLPYSLSKPFKVKLVSALDINLFIMDYTRALARKLCVDYDKLYELIREENDVFYSVMDNIFKGIKSLPIDNKNLVFLKNYLRVPQIPTEISNPVKNILTKFNRLTNIQKAQVLSELKLFSINVENVLKKEDI